MWLGSAEAFKRSEYPVKNGTYEKTNETRSFRDRFRRKIAVTLVAATLGAGALIAIPTAANATTYYPHVSNARTCAQQYAIHVAGGAQTLGPCVQLPPGSGYPNYVFYSTWP
jgi:hypothetical protein